MANRTFEKNTKHLIGMVHLLPLPGTPRFAGNVDVIYSRALTEARLLMEAGFDGIIIENFGDEPYLIGEPTPTQLALMAAIVREIRQTVAIPIGVNVQFNAWEAEIAIAYACEAQFVRVEVFVDTVISAQGIVPPCSAQITRLRKALGADAVELWVDVQTKYTTPLVPQPIAQSAREAQAAGADALIVTGSGNGQATPLEAVADVKATVPLPVIVGSGTNVANVSDVLNVADGAIVGSALKEGGSVYNPVSAQAATEFMKVAQRIR
jgi:uncharacterized protein